MYDRLISILQSELEVLIGWFKGNKTQAKPDKLQVIAVGKKSSKIFLNILSCEETVN